MRHKFLISLLAALAMLIGFVTAAQAQRALIRVRGVRTVGDLNAACLQLRERSAQIVDDHSGLENAVNQIAKLPGIGKKTALRLALRNSIFTKIRQQF